MSGLKDGTSLFWTDGKIIYSWIENGVERRSRRKRVQGTWTLVNVSRNDVAFAGRMRRVFVFYACDNIGMMDLDRRSMRVGFCFYCIHLRCNFIDREQSSVLVSRLF